MHAALCAASGNFILVLPFIAVLVIVCTSRQSPFAVRIQAQMHIWLGSCRQFADGLDILTVEIEHIDAGALEGIASHLTVEPEPATLRIIQVSPVSLLCTVFPISSPPSLTCMIQQHHWHIISLTGLAGKGQVSLHGLQLPSLCSDRSAVAPARHTGQP